jgi:hypothetical protein
VSDDLPFYYGETPPPDDRPPKPCRHPRYLRASVDGIETCMSCGHAFDPLVKRRGRNNRGRGLSIQRQVAGAAEMEHIPGNGPADARDANFYAEIKSGPAWYSRRVEAELDNLPTDTGRLPVFIAASTPGPGRSRRVYATMGLGDLVKLVGGHAQVSMWLPEWVALKRDDAA